MAIFDQIHAAGNTIVLVTHEEEIADHAKRIIRLRDGVIESDSAKINLESAGSITSSL
jgi:putative ABC transport system ATP-binding protein